MPLRRDQQGLDEGAEVEPGADLEIAIDRQHQRDRRTEEAQVRLGLAAHAGMVALGDAKQAVEVPADLAAPREIGLAEGHRIVAILLLARGGIVERGGDQRGLQPGAGPGPEHAQAPGLHVGAARCPRRQFDQTAHQGGIDGIRQEGAHGAAAGDGLLDRLSRRCTHALSGWRAARKASCSRIRSSSSALAISLRVLSRP